MTMLTVRRLPYPPVSPVCFLPSNATNCRVSHLCTPSREVGDKSSVTPADPPTDRRQNAPPAFTSSFASNNPMEVDGTFTSVTPPAATVAATGRPKERRSERGRSQDVVGNGWHASWRRKGHPNRTSEADDYLKMGCKECIFSHQGSK